jgi:hypothetical protein
MDAETLELLRSSLVHVLTEAADTPLAARLDDLGWDEVVADDAPSAVRALFETKGATLSPADALGPMVAGRIADALDDPTLAAAAVVLPTSLHPDRLSSRLDGAQAIVGGVVTSRPAPGATAVVPAADEAGAVRLYIASVGPEWTCEMLEGTDPSLGLARVAATLDPAAVTVVAAAPSARAWEEAVTLARWALAAELVSIARHVIEQVVVYTGQRQQYGRPIGSFQAVQHRLAGAYATLVGATDVVQEASTAGSPWVALVAKALAGQAAETACIQAQQAYGAIGFTWEHPFHHSLRRTLVIDWMFGDWRTLEDEMGRRLLDDASVHRIGKL